MFSSNNHSKFFDYAVYLMFLVVLGWATVEIFNTKGTLWGWVMVAATTLVAVPFVYGLIQEYLNGWVGFFETPGDYEDEDEVEDEDEITPADMESAGGKPSRWPEPIPMTRPAKSTKNKNGKNKK